LDEHTSTYTYTARSSEDPDKVVTFTLYDGHMRVNLTGVLEQASSVANAEDRPAEMKHQVGLQARPAFMKLYENVSGPVAITDVRARLHHDRFALTAWPRVAGLRLAPLRLNLGPVDNQEAAAAFVDELKKRKKSSSQARKFPGPLDYWFGWLGLLLLGGLLVLGIKSKVSS